MLVFVCGRTANALISLQRNKVAFQALVWIAREISYPPRVLSPRWHLESWQWPSRDQNAASLSCIRQYALLDWYRTLVPIETPSVT